MTPMDESMNFRATALSLLARVQAGLSHTELVYVPHSKWPLAHRESSVKDAPNPLRISILDASFNPPTLAHLALVNAPRPRSQATDDYGISDRGKEEKDYDARVLLLSVKNADKTLKPTDATYIQRLEMMHLLAGHVSRPAHSDYAPHSTAASANVAIGIVNEPTFVGKSTSILSFLNDRLDSFSTNVTTAESTASITSVYTTIPKPRFELSFIVGMDTLKRLVAPRYYGSEESMAVSLNRFLSPEEDSSVIVCARRNTQPSTFTPTATSSLITTTTVDDVPESAKRFIGSGRIKLIDIGAEESTYSSTNVRNTVKELGVNEVGRQVWGKFVVPNVVDYIAKEGLYSE
jgi:nicotinamide-nucleotide adenylyltransferase